MRVLFRRMNFVVHTFFHRLWIVMVRRLSIGNLFLHQYHFSYKEVLHLLILVHNGKTPFTTAEFIRAFRGTLVSREIVFRVLVGISPFALFSFSSNHELEHLEYIFLIITWLVVSISFHKIKMEIMKTY